MIHIGARVTYALKLTCPECGQPAVNRFPWESAFIGFGCDNQECILGGRMVTIEKSTAVVISVDPPLYAQYKKEGWEQCFPLLADKDGNQVWPKK